jgi:hypothetical protein
MEKLIRTSKNVPCHVRMGTHRLRLQEPRVNQEGNQEKAIAAWLLG